MNPSGRVENGCAKYTTTSAGGNLFLRHPRQERSYRVDSTPNHAYHSEHMAAPSQLVGRALGRYQILEQIGEGGMGVVYRAHDGRLDREVALKALPTGSISDEAARKRFHREALTLSRLSHHRIATIFDFDSQEGVDFLVMELIPGITLDQKLALGRLPEPEFLPLGVQLADGLAAAHRSGVI